MSLRPIFILILLFFNYNKILVMISQDEFCSFDDRIDDEDEKIYWYYQEYEDQSNDQLWMQNKKNSSDSKMFAIKNSKERQYLTFVGLEVLEPEYNLLKQKQSEKQSTQNEASQRFQSQTNPSDKEEGNSKKCQQETTEKSSTKKISKRKKNLKSLNILNTESIVQESRQIKLNRYRQKKLKRNWSRGILYEERKKLAFKRNRVQGRFQSKSQLSLEMTIQKKSDQLFLQQKKPEF